MGVTSEIRPQNDLLPSSLSLACSARSRKGSCPVPRPTWQGTEVTSSQVQPTASEGLGLILVRDPEPEDSEPGHMRAPDTQKL